LLIFIFYDTGIITLKKYFRAHKKLCSTCRTTCGSQVAVGFR